MKTIEQIKAGIDVLVRKQGNQGALNLGDVLDEIVDTISITLSSIPDIATFSAAVPNTATEIVFAFSGDVDLTGYTKTTSIGVTIDVYANDTKYVIVSPLPIYAPSSCSSMFASKRALTSLDLSNFNTTNVTDMALMFNECAALTSLDLSNFNTTNVTLMSYMFSDCAALTSLNLSNFNTTNVTNMFSMFSGCAALTSLDLSNFNTTNVTWMSDMFFDCAALTSLDLSNFNTTNVEDMSDMFDGCSGLTTIIANNWSAAGDSSGMFNGCTSLVGGNGTTYNASHVDATYAHIDVADNPGYFTAPA